MEPENGNEREVAAGSESSEGLGGGLRTITVLIDVPAEWAEKKFREMITDCSEELIKSDLQTLTAHFVNRGA